MSEQQASRIGEAKRRALDAKQKLGVAAAAAFVAILGLAWASHPGSSSGSSAGAAADQSSSDQNDSFLAEDDDFGGFDSFGSIAPSGGAAPQAQTHVS